MSDTPYVAEYRVGPAIVRFTNRPDMENMRKQTAKFAKQILLHEMKQKQKGGDDHEAHG